jgi:hypothetical protein
MTEFLFFVVATIGMTLIVTRGDIFSEFRNWVLSFAPKLPDNTPTQMTADGTPVIPAVPPLTTKQYLIHKVTKAINCCQCTGFWCGVFCGVWYVYYGNNVYENSVMNLFKLFLCGCIGSVVSLTADLVLEYFIRHISR